MDGTRDDKSRRYDRQLRIWGAHGQAALEAAQVCVLGSGPTATETLKNLVLGGIAGFTVVDDARVEQRDLGTNFLIDASQVGASRAAAVTDNLKELNEAVVGSYVEASPGALLSDNPDFFRRFALVVATQIGEQEQVALDRLCREQRVPLLVARSYGLVGYMRVSVTQHCVVESKPDNILDDLRLSNPWRELADFAAAVDLDSLDDVHHKHVPYVVLLLQAAATWRAEHGGALPKGSAEQSQFRAAIRAHIRRRDGFPLDEENFAEAVTNANKVWASTGISPEVKRVLDDAEASQLSRSAPHFWVLVAALRQFVERHGVLPLEGSLPDMTSTTAMYLALQQVYRAKADADVAEVEAAARRLLEAAGREADELPAKAVKLFCKNARNIRVVRYRPLAEEFSAEGVRCDALKHALGCEEAGANASLYVLLRAADRFARKNGRYPGAFDSDIDGDVAALKSTAVQVLAEAGCSGGHVSDDLAAEMVRYGASELHAVAAVMGGAAAQEAIKLVTNQFVPLPATLIYNAMASTTSLLDL